MPRSVVWADLKDFKSLAALEDKKRRDAEAAPVADIEDKKRRGAEAARVAAYEWRAGQRG